MNDVVVRSLCRFLRSLTQLGDHTRQSFQCLTILGIVREQFLFQAGVLGTLPLRSPHERV